MNRLYKHSLLLLLVVFAGRAMAQNIVPNPGFELKSNCTPGKTGTKLSAVLSWEGVSHTPDYFHLCNPLFGYNSSLFGYQYPRTGDAHMGMYIYLEPAQNPPYPGWDTFYSEAIMCKLDKKMIAGKTYDVSFYCNYAYTGINNNHCIAVEGVGVYFSDTVIPDNRSLWHLSVPYSVRSTPGVYLTDSMGWMKISGTYVAKGGEEYMTLGMFNEGKAIAYQMMYYFAQIPSQQRICYMFFDDLYVAPRCDTVTRVHDTFTCQYITPTTPVTLAPPAPGGIYTWSNGSSTATTGVSSAGTYIRTNDVNGCDYHIDSFYVHEFKEGTTIVHDTAYCAPAPNAVISIMARDSATSYLWNTGDTTKTISVHEGMYYCRLLKNCAWHTDSFHVAVKPSPGAVTTGSNSPVCEGDSLTFFVVDTTVNASYAWYGPNGSAGNNKNIVVAPAGTGHGGWYIITVTKNGCTVRDSTLAIVKPLPDKPRISSNSPVAEGEEVRLKVTNPVAGAGFSWIGPFSFTSQLQDVAFTATQRSVGVYIVTTTLDGCSVSALTTVAVKDSSLFGFILFPSPNNGSFTIKGYARSDYAIAVHITDAAGKTVYRNVILPVNKLVDEEFHLEGRLASGDYMLRLLADGKQHAFKFTVFR